jgi:hypothetical protein
MNTLQLELESIKELYRQEMKKLYQATLSGAPREELQPRKQLIEKLIQKLGQRTNRRAF